MKKRIFALVSAMIFAVFCLSSCEVTDAVKSLFGKTALRLQYRRLISIMTPLLRAKTPKKAIKTDFSECFLSSRIYGRSTRWRN